VPVVNAAARTQVTTRRRGALLSRWVAGCGTFWSVYSDLTNQVPATWFACDAGIRRLASLSDGPARGRRRFFTDSDVRHSPSAQSQLPPVATLADRRRQRAALRSARSASTNAVTTSSR